MKSRIAHEPPKRLEPLEVFTLYGRAESFECYQNDTHHFDDTPPVWSGAEIERLIADSKLDLKRNQYYTDSGSDADIRLYRHFNYR